MVCKGFLAFLTYIRAVLGVAGNEVSITTEPAALEMAVSRGKIEHVIVCGHADCKAINTLYNLHQDPASFNPQSPMDNWLRKHGFRSISKLDAMQKAEEKQLPDARRLEFAAENPELLRFWARIDADNCLNVEDRLSQINALQQMCHIASHAFLHSYLIERRVHLHALWFDIYKGN